jgi:phage FluMu protein Com
MPIRFRCRYCNQLLGIARRKSGTQVQCPTCRAELTVPVADEVEEPAPAANPPLFERDDFEDFLNGGSASSARAPAPPAPMRAPPRPAPAPPVYESEPYSPVPSPAPQSSPGLVLSPARATVLTVVLIVLLAIAFGSGLLVGRFCL